MQREASTHETTFEFEGFDRNITVTFWWNQITMQVAIIDRVVLTDTGQSLDFILGDEELAGVLAERIEKEGEELRKESALERSISYMDEY